jgi:leucine dehydrogenase
MDVFEIMAERDHEEIIFCNDDEVGLKAIIAIHNTVLGPAIGGCRMYPYKTTDDAMQDALRISRGMTYKAAVAGLDLGGGKSVIIADPKDFPMGSEKREELFRCFGRFLQAAAGRFITAEDVGTSVQDMEYVKMETDSVGGISMASGGSGDPSPVTAYGTFRGIQACVNKAYRNPSLKGLKIVVEGIGKVGHYLVKHLYDEGARVFVYDRNQDKVKKIMQDYDGVEFIEGSKIYGFDGDIYSPCALGATINDDSIKKFKFKIIAGSANNQLAVEEKHGKMILEKGIIYAPDFVINSGGLINVYSEMQGYNQDKALSKARNIYDAVAKVLDIAETDNIPSYLAANKLAEERIAARKKANKDALAK